ncbi:ATP-grasp fold amidoligase family protein [Pseudomonas sp. PS01297]|uniref:ATP-grasp fold amidoligase family protein n=1 Tax=Pseudomonas sp. PS01297 TaxID=2991433 RepID=UPI00249A5924|nr:ATP-grasp fold amidoligase family protein [Pseudomonas sp. PS01297]
MKNLLPDWIYFQLVYVKNYKRLGNFSQPQKFSEKLFARIQNPLPAFSMLADKVKVREYVSKTVGDQYLIPCYGTYERLTPEDFKNLPESFVLKANHGAGQVLVVKDKSTLSPESVCNQANKWLKDNYGDESREKHYLNIPRRLLAEKALLQEGNSPDDYKVHVFNPRDGRAPHCFIQLMKGRNAILSQAIYLSDWTKAPFWRAGYSAVQQKDNSLRPICLEEMLEVAIKLTGTLGYARVDFYVHDDRLYFGEVTLTPAGGRVRFEPAGLDAHLGKLFSWPDRMSD